MREFIRGVQRVAVPGLPLTTMLGHTITTAANELEGIFF